MTSSKVASKTSPDGSSWRRDKKVSVPWKVYELERRGEVSWTYDLRRVSKPLDRPVQGWRVFRQSSFVVLLVLKIFNSLSYRAFAGFSETFRLHELLGEEKTPSYRTINNAMNLLSEEFLCAVNRLITPKCARLEGIDSSGLNLRRKGAWKGAWVTLRFKRLRNRGYYFRKLHILTRL